MPAELIWVHKTFFIVFAYVAFFTFFGKTEIGTFLFVGPTGTGKTETARALSSELDCKLIKFDMSVVT